MTLSLADLLQTSNLSFTQHPSLATKIYFSATKMYFSASFFSHTQKSITVTYSVRICKSTQKCTIVYVSYPPVNVTNNSITKPIVKMPCQTALLNCFVSQATKMSDCLKYTVRTAFMTLMITNTFLISSSTLYKVSVHFMYCYGMLLSFPYTLFHIDNIK